MLPEVWCRLLLLGLERRELAPVPPPMAQFPRSVEGCPGGTGSPLNPNSNMLPRGVPSGCRISETSSRIPVRVTSAIVCPGWDLCS
jgi:hypothetical protein